MQKSLASLKLTIKYSFKDNKKVKSKSFTTNVAKWIKLTPEEQNDLITSKLKEGKKLLSWSV